MRLTDLFISMRPRQWTKNLVVFAALIFDQKLSDPYLFRLCLQGFAAFCMFSSSVYLLNDLKDRKQDAAHPIKRNRPIASGRLSSSAAWGSLVVLLGVALGLSVGLGRGFVGVGISYLVLNILYSFALRKVVILDVIAIATGFVLRAIAGAAILRGAGLDVVISPWLLICTFFLSLFLALGKRHNELKVVDGGHRPSLRGYSLAFIDRLLVITAGTTLLAYSIYTIWPDTVENFGTTRLVYTIPFVFYGLCRYLYLVTEEDKGGDPSEMLISQKSIILTVFLWFVCVAWILYL